MNQSVQIEEIQKLWDLQLELQTDLLFPLEIPIFIRHQKYFHGKSFIDLGVGNGIYLKRLIQFLPNNKYLGIDKSDYFVEKSKKNLSEVIKSDLEISVKKEDVYTVTGKYDVAIARLLIQHLLSLDEFMEKMVSIMNTDGLLFIIESCDDDRVFCPPIPLMESFFKDFRMNRKTKGLNRDAIVEIEANCKSYGFEIVDKFKVTSSSIIPGHKDIFRKTYLNILKLVQQDFDLSFKYSDLITQIEEWHSKDNSYTHLSLRILILKRE